MFRQWLRTLDTDHVEVERCIRVDYRNSESKVYNRSNIEKARA